MSEKQKDRSMSNENFLIVKNLTHIYSQGKKNLKILDKINLKLCKGEMVALIGPSGAGKTTILNLVGLLDEVQKGEIILEDELINPSNSKLRNNIRLKKIGFVFQSHRLLPEFTARENISIPQMLSGLTKTLALKRSDELLEMLGMENKKYSRPGILSGGEQQRVSIARGLANAPKILLADEPTGNLDPNISDEILDLLEICTNNGAAVLMSTHNFPLIKPRNKTFIELNQGRMVE